MGEQIKHFYEFGPFRLDATERLLLRDGHHVPLTPKAFEVLMVLVANGGHVIDKDELIRKVWPDTFVEEVNLAKNVYSLRKILCSEKSEKSEQYIETIPRRGYRFVAGVKEFWGDHSEEPVPESANLHPNGEPAGQLTGPLTGALAKVEPGKEQIEKRPDGFEERVLPINGSNLLGAKSLDLTTIRQLLLKKQLGGPLGLLAICLAVGVVAWILLLDSHPEVPDHPQKIYPLTSFPGREDQAVFSPDGNQVAFVWNGEEGNNTDIYIKMVGGEKLLRLTTDPASEIYPAWSPDGRNIAFMRTSNEQAGIYLVPALGGSEQKLTDVYPTLPVILGNMLNYAPDGKLLAFPDKATQEDPFSIFQMTVETGEKQKLTSPPAGSVGDLYPVFSPDQKTLAFVRFSNISGADIYLVSASGGEPKRLTFDGSPVRGLVWTSGGSEIVYSSRRAGSIYNFWKVPVGGGTPERLMVSEHDVLNPAISRQGNRFVYTRSFLDMNIMRFGLNDLTAKSDPPLAVAPSTQDDDSPNYSPDGKKIVFASRRTGNFEIWMCDSDGSNPRQLTTMGGPLTGTPRWSPDGRQIVFDSWYEGNADLYLINADGGKPRRLTSDPAEEITPSWSRDGKSIYFASTSSGSMQIWKMPAAGGPAVQITKNGGFEGFESLDGRYLYYAKGRIMPGIWRVPVAGGDETLVLNHHQAGLWRYWTVTEKGIFFATAETASRPVVEFFNFATGKISQVTVLERPLARTLPGLSVSPDGRWLLVVQAYHDNLDIMMVENFR